MGQRGPARNPQDAGYGAALRLAGMLEAIGARRMIRDRAGAAALILPAAPKLRAGVPWTGRPRRAEAA